MAGLFQEEVRNRDVQEFGAKRAALSMRFVSTLYERHCIEKVKVNNPKFSFTG